MHVDTYMESRLYIGCIDTSIFLLAALHLYHVFFMQNPIGVIGAFLLRKSLMRIRLGFPLTTSEHCFSAAVLINGSERVTLT